MFSFALWDNYKQTLTLCRDRIEKKALYYGWSNDLLLFSSELKLYKIIENLKKKINHNVITAIFKEDTSLHRFQFGLMYINYFLVPI